MKTKLLLAAAALCMLAPAAPASAVDVGGQVASTCTATPSTNTIDFGSLTNQGGATLQTATIALFCNSKFTLSYTSAHGRLVNTDVTDSNLIGPETGDGANSYNGSSQFFAALDYQIDPPHGITTVDISAGTPVQDPAGESDPLAVDFPFNFNTIPLPSGEYLTAGHYSDTLTISLTPTGL
jgi:spore coat protein U-like protein